MPASAWAADPVWSEQEALTASPESLLAAAASLPEERRAEVAVLWSGVHYAFDGDGRATVRRHLVYRLPRAVDDEDYEEMDLAQVHWAPWYQDRPSLRARVITPSGAILELDPATISERPVERWSDDVFSDARVLEAPLPGLVDGSLVEVVSETRDRSPFFAAGSAHREVLQISSFVAAGRLSIDVPASAQLRFQVEGSAPIRSIERTTDGVRNLSFEYTALARPETWQFSVPPADLPDPSVVFSNGLGWTEIAKAYGELVEERVRDARIDDWLKSGRLLELARKPDRRAIIEAVLRRVDADVRYTGLELGAQAIVPFRPEQTIQRGYGDCKDQATLVVAALRRLGVEARVALLRAGQDRDVVESLPGMGLFNHAIVYVPGAPEYWVDPTMKRARLGDLPAADLDRYALLAGSDPAPLVRTPTSPPGGRRRIVTREVFVPSVGKGRVTETSEFFGMEEVEARQRFEGGSAKSQREALEEYAESNFLKAKLDRYEMPSATDLEQTVHSALEMSASGRVVADSTAAVVAVMVSDVLAELPWGLQSAPSDDDEEEEDPEDRRRLPYLVGQEQDVTLRYVIHLPPGMAVRDAGRSSTDEVGPITLRRSVSHPAPDRTEAEVRLEIRRATLTPAQFEDVRERLAKLREEPAIIVFFDHLVNRHLVAGELRQAIVLGHRLAASEPKSAFRHQQLATAYLAAGLGAEARKQARLATELDPKSAAAQQTLGWCLQHDEIGRRFGPGYPRAEALAAYRKAVELEADRAVAKADLAILLEHDEKGRRYQSQDDLAEAIRIYQELDEDDALGGLKQNLPIALNRAGRPAEALKHLERATAYPSNGQVRAVAVALENGTQAAIDEVRQSVSDAGTRQQILMGVSRDLLALGRYEPAAALARAAATDAQGAAEILRIADAFEKAAKSPIDRGSPEGALVQVMGLIESDDMLRDARPLLAPQVLDAFGDNQRLLLGGQLGSEAVVRMAGTNGFNAKTLLDVAFSGATITREGNEHSGLRLRFSLGGAATQSVYAAHSESGWKLALAMVNSGAAGAMALDRLAKDDLPGARTWLDWGVEADTGGERSALRQFWGDDEPTDELAAKRAALAAVVQAGGMPAYVAELEKLRDGATEADRRTLDLAIARGAALRVDPPALRAAGQRLEAYGKKLTSEELRLVGAGYSKARDTGGLQALIQQQTEKFGTSADLERASVLLAFDRGRLEEGIALVDRLEQAGNATSFELNSAAWAALFGPDVTEATLKRALRAADLSGYKSSAILHTLSAVYAWRGQDREAYKVLLQSLAVGERGTPDGAHWLVLGRMCENYELKDAAIAALSTCARDGVGQ